MAANVSETELSGQVALGTGGGRGIGQAAAEMLASAGAAVVVAARSEREINETAERIQQAGGRALAIAVDVTDETGVDRMMDQIEREFGRLDILVNNAGIIDALGPIWETAAQAWKRVLDVNLYGCYLCARAALKLMIPRRRGRIINVASGAALGPIARGSAYCVSKAALARLNEQIAEEAGEYGIAAFVIDPGTVRTAMAEYLMESEAGRTHTPWFREFVLAGGDVPIDLSANLIRLLASGKADALSGRFFAVWMDAPQMIQRADQIRKADLYTLRLNQLPKEPSAADT
jgi:NAD(P)-dependent dehydrogenase (short-subunit alcohol dehydrogenase family)